MPSQHRYFHTHSNRYPTGEASQLAALRSRPIRGMAPQSCRPRSISLGSPPQDMTLHETYYHDANTQRNVDFCKGLPRQCDLTNIHPRNHDVALAATLNQLDHFLGSRNFCRHFMLRLCSAEKCVYVHDALFRDTFMVLLFGDAWRDFSSRYFPKDAAGRGFQIDQSPGHLEDTINADQHKSDVISFEPPSALNVAAGLYMPPSPPETHGYVGVSSEMELEKSEGQGGTGSEDARHLHSVVESSQPLRRQRRRRQRLYAVRHRVSVWGKSAWRRSVTTKRKKTLNESEVALEQAY